MKVDICSIMYNESAMLSMWLESWLSLPWINKINLVDGGSTDNSVQIARSYGDRVSVITVPWQNDFSRQRNIAIKLAKSEWLLQADLDELPCGNIKNKYLGEYLNRQDVNQIHLPYIKFYDWKTLWFFNDGNTPSFHVLPTVGKTVNFGFKSTMTIFRKNHLLGYSKSLHEMPLFSGQEKSISPAGNSEGLGELEKHYFLVGHYDQAKHLLQAKKSNRSVEFEMGMKRLRYRLISPATYENKVYDANWARTALQSYENGDKSMIEELGAAQLKAFKKQHTILENYDASCLNNEFVRKYV